MGYDPLRPQPTSMKVDMVSDATNKVLDYEYDYKVLGTGENNNRIRKITDKIDTQYTTTYTYDAYNRLERANWTGDGRFYQYDEWGNIKSVNIGLTYHYTANTTGAPATNRLDSVALSGVTQTTYGYDAAGNTTSGDSKTFAYDAVNRLKSVNSGASTYGYDGDGKRVRVTDGGANVFYIYSSALGQSVMEVTSSGVQRAYVYGGGKVVAMQATDGQFYWLHQNHLGNSRAMTDSSGNLTYKGQFDPFGQVLSEWASSGNNNLNSKKFTGYERDTATGLDYAQARMYNSARGRFTKPDPMGLKAADLKHPQSLNRYAYVENDPVNFIDPTGRLKAYSVGLCTIASIPSGMDGGGSSWFASCPSIGSSDDDGAGMGAGGSYVLGLDDSGLLRGQANDFFKDKPACKDFVNNVAQGLGLPSLDSALSKIKFVNTTVQGAAPLNEKMSKLGFGSVFGNRKLSEIMVTDTDRPRALANPFFGSPYYGAIFFSDKHFEDDMPTQRRTAAHEVLHVVFRGGHEAVVKSLGLTAFPGNYNEDQLSVLINNFLDAGCDLSKLPPPKQE